MSYCQHCGTQLVDEAKFCYNCGKQTTPNNEPINYELIDKLSSRLKTNGGIWIGIAVLQILVGLSGAWSILVVGILNIISASIDIKYSKDILTNQNGIIKKHEPLVGPIITLVYNLFIGGLFGVLGSAYYLICVRGFVLENRTKFLAMETSNAKENNTPQPKDSTQSASADAPKNQSKSGVYISTTLTINEAELGAQKSIYIPELCTTLTIKFPKGLSDGQTLIIHSAKGTDANGNPVNKDIFITIRTA